MKQMTPKNLCKWTLTMAMAVIFCAFCVMMAAQSVSGTCGDQVKWSLENGVLIVSGNGPMPDFGQAPWYDLRTKIHTVIVEDGVTRVGTYAFYNCENLREAVFPDSVTEIGDMAFYGCRLLKKFRFPKELQKIGVMAFYYCRNLTEAKLPNGLQKIEQTAFARCLSLKKVTLPKSLQTVGLGAFSDCTALEQVRYQGTREQWAQIRWYANDDLFAANVRCSDDAFNDLPAVIAILVGLGIGAWIVRYKKRSKQ